MDKKIIPFDKVSAFVGKLRRSKKKSTIALCHGCFDIVHPGHIRHLKFAKEQASYLFVSITPDSCVQKGSARPYVPEELRAENLAALEIVDAVIVAPKETGREPIEEIEPDIYVKGSEYAVSVDPRFLKEKELVEKLGGTVVYSSGDVVFSSSRFIRDYEMDTAEAEKLKFVCRHYGVTSDIIKHALSSARDRKILIIGEAIIDEYKYGEGIGIAQESPILSISLKHRSCYVGGAAALALHLAAIGADVTFMTSVSSESNGYTLFTQTLADFNISLVNVEDRHRAIVFKSHYFANQTHVLELEDGPHRSLDSNLRSKILRRFRSELKNCPDSVVLSDFGYGLLSADLVSTMCQAAHKKDIDVVADIAMTLRTQIGKFSKANVFVASEMELRSCLHDYENGLSVIVDGIYSDHDIGEVFLPLGDGSVLFFKRPNIAGDHNMESAHIPNLLPTQGSNMGTGEAFVAGLVTARAAYANEVQCMYMGAVFSAVHARASGNGPINSEDLFQFLSGRKEL